MSGRIQGSLAAEKSAMRSLGRELRERQSFWHRVWRSRRVVRKVQQLSAYRHSPVIFAYFPVRGEVDVRSLIRAALKAGKTVALPRVAGRRRIEFYRVGGLEELVPGSFGIPEPRPIPGRRATLARAGLILVPGLAFSFDGHRLGFGGGYYDALLPGRDGVALGLGFDFQMRGRLPFGPHDARLDGVVTDRRILVPASI